MLERASRPGYVAAGTTITEELMDGVDIKECTCIEYVVEHQRVAFQVA